MLLCALLLGLAGVTQVQAQVLRARMLDRTTGEPIAGAFVSLLAADGTAVVSGLTGATGWVQLQAGSAGSYTIRVERLGYTTHTTAQRTLEGTVTEEFRIDQQPIQLPAVVASVNRQCRGPQAPAAEAAVLWEEIRKALSVTEWTAREASVRYTLRSTRREYYAGFSRPIRETTHEMEVSSTGGPFRSFGAQDLSERGFIRTAAQGGYQWFGPDAEVILSPWFQERHCFDAVTSKRRPGQVGLRFTPTLNAPTYDIEGTLWLDRATGELRVLEYWYVKLPGAGTPGEARGETVFERLPSGRWIVSSWWIRAPRRERHMVSGRFRNILDELRFETVSIMDRPGG